MKLRRRVMTDRHFSDAWSPPSRHAKFITTRLRAWASSAGNFTPRPLRTGREPLSSYGSRCRATVSPMTWRRSWLGLNHRFPFSRHSAQRAARALIAAIFLARFRHAIVGFLPTFLYFVRRTVARSRATCLARSRFSGSNEIADTRGWPPPPYFSARVARFWSAVVWFQGFVPNDTFARVGEALTLTEYTASGCKR